MAKLTPNLTAILTLEEFKSRTVGGDSSPLTERSSLLAITCVPMGNLFKIINGDEVLYQMGKKHTTSTIYRFLGWFPSNVNTNGLEMKYVTIDENWCMHNVDSAMVEGAIKL